MITVVDVWRIKAWAIPLAFFYMAWHRRIRRSTSFAKLLGTGAGRTFTPRDADLRQWAILTVWKNENEARAWSDNAAVRAWNRISTEHATIWLRAISSQGTWSGKSPFVVAPPSSQGQVAAITRARIKNRLSRRFWRSVPAVTRDLHDAPGLIAAIGIGEAPVGLQGTFSLWRDNSALKAFAYQGSAHRDVISRTHELQWYAEELFARFEVIQARGRLQGHDLNPAR